MADDLPPLKLYAPYPGGGRMVARRVGDVVHDPFTGQMFTIEHDQDIVFLPSLCEMHGPPDMLDRIAAEAERRHDRKILPFRPRGS